MTQTVDVVILGFGTAGISALSEVRKVTKNFVVVHQGPHGTTCARVGCMPSKTLIQATNDFTQHGIFSKQPPQKPDVQKILHHVRMLRDQFVSGVLKTVEATKDHIIHGNAHFLEPSVLSVDTHVIRTKATLIATGSRPKIPHPWMSFQDALLTSDDVFDLTDLPSSLAVVGLGAIGIELGHAFSRLGVEVTGIGKNAHVGGLTDPVVHDHDYRLLSQELPLWCGEAAECTPKNTLLQIKTNTHTTLKVEKALVCMGRTPNTDTLGLETLGIPQAAVPIHPNTLQVGTLPIFMAGDVTGHRAVQHEAVDEGRIAGYNCVHMPPHSFQRRVKLQIVFSDPQIALVGKSYAELRETPFLIGEASFETQGRALIMGQPSGFLRIYGETSTGRLLGSEMIAPHGEHLAHLLAWALQQNMTVFQAHCMPFYHPTLEEGLRSALKDLAKKTRPSASSFELL